MPDFPIEPKEDDMLSRATSYSSFYVIDEKEEARLKQVAFEKFMAEKAIEEQVARREQALLEAQNRPRVFKSRGTKAPKRQVNGQDAGVVSPDYSESNQEAERVNLMD